MSSLFTLDTRYKADDQLLSSGDMVELYCVEAGVFPLRVKGCPALQVNATVAHISLIKDPARRICFIAAQELESIVDLRPPVLIKVHVASRLQVGIQSSM